MTGSADGKVLIWSLPDPTEQPLDAVLTYVQKTLDTNEQQVSVWADPVQVPVPSWVVSGVTATMVIHPNEVVKTDEQPK